MAAFKIRQTVDMNSSGPQEIKQAHGHVGDKKAHEWEVSVVRGGAPVDLTGYTAMALVNNGVGTVQITGAITGNVASAVFPAACYTEGTHDCFMRITNAGDSSEAITAKMHLNVTTGETDAVIDPGSDITLTLSGLLASEAARVAAEEERAAFYDGFSSQLDDIKTDNNGITYDAPGNAIRLQMASVNSKVDAILDWHELAATITANNAYVGGNVGATIAETSTASFRYLVASVSGLTSIKVTYYAQGWLYNAYFTDDAGKILRRDLYRENGHTKEQKTDVEIIVPANGKKIYINSMAWGALYVKGKIAPKGSRWLNRICDCFGDSITEQGLWQPYVKNALGFATMLNHGVGGTSVGGGAEYPESVNSFWQNVRINALSGAAECLIIMGGTNDGGKQIPLGTVSKATYGVTSFVGAYNTMLTKIFCKYYNLTNGYYANIDYSGIVRNSVAKDVKIFLVTPTFCPDPTFSGADFSRMEAIVDAILKIGKWWNIPVIDNYHNAGINEQNSAMLLADGVHPNSAGAKRLASVIAGGLMGNQPLA